MSDRLQIRKDGLYELEWDSEEKAWLPTHKPDPNTIFTQLRVSCDMQEGVTLRHIFNMVDEYPQLRDFLSQYSWCRDIKKFHLNALLPKESTEVFRLEIGQFADSSHHIERVKYKGGKRETIIAVSYEVHAHFGGIGLDPEHPEWGEIGYSLGASQMYDIVDLPLALIPTFKVQMPFMPGRQQEEVRELFESSKDFSLLDILDVIYWEISFYGNPEDNESA